MRELTNMIKRAMQSGVARRMQEMSRHWSNGSKIRMAWREGRHCGTTREQPGLKT